MCVRESRGQRGGGGGGEFKLDDCFSWMPIEQNMNTLF